MSLMLTRKRVVLVDLDIRKGTLSRHFRKHPVGVTNYLADDSIALDDIIHTDEKSGGLDIISSGTVAPNPAELLMDGRLDTLIDELRKRYDYIIVDNVPVGIVADATISNRISDLTIFVARAASSTAASCPTWRSFTAKASSATCRSSSTALTRNAGATGMGMDTAMDMVTDMGSTTGKK